MVDKKPYLVPIPGTRKLERLKENVGASDIHAIKVASQKRMDKLSCMFYYDCINLSDRESFEKTF